MVDINNDKENIINFLSKTVLKFCEEVREPKSVGIFCKPSEGFFTISFNSEFEIDKEKINSIEFEHKSYESYIIENWKVECQKEISQWKYFKEGGIFESSGAQKLYNINRYLTHILSTIFRESTIKINLPTTLLSFEFVELNSIIIHSNLENFGRTITRLFRNEIFETYLKEKDYYKKIEIEEFKININPNFDEQTRNLMLEKSAFYLSLTKEQIQTLDKIILGQLDSTAFNVMRSLDENNEEQTKIKLTVNNLDARQLPLIGNGNLSGEYFDWVERFSKFGEYQH
jgi:hypothetical protein